VDSASTVSQQYGIIVHSIYATGVGRAGRNAWEVQLGQSGIAKIADETGGEYYSLGLQNPISFKPYLDRLQRIFDNQYFLVFQATPDKKSGLQRVRISTNVPNMEIASANNVWVPGGSYPAEASILFDGTVPITGASARVSVSAFRILVRV